LDAEKIEFSAGQYCRLKLPKLDDTNENRSRKFSILNSPDDNRRLIIATRSGVTHYKTTLLNLQPGEQVTIEKIKGKLILPNTLARPLVFIAGGIGIVPFISMLRDLDHNGDIRGITLLYFNRTQASSPYLEELQQLAVAYSEFRLVLIMTRDPGWQGEIAKLSEQLFSMLIARVKARDYI
jgi:ferredoxin-NADP reductase